MNLYEYNLRLALEEAKQKSYNGKIYIVWREDYRHRHDEFIVSEFDDYIRGASLMADEYGCFEGGNKL
jgi:hypothetical protein